MTGRASKIFITGGSGLAGLSLGATFGIQTAMSRLPQLSSPLGDELRQLETLRSQFKRKGFNQSKFESEAAEAEAEKLQSRL